MLKFLWMLPLYIYLFHKMCHIHFFSGFISFRTEKENQLLQRIWANRHITWSIFQHNTDKEKQQQQTNMQHNKKQTNKTTNKQFKRQRQIWMSNKEEHKMHSLKV